MPGEGVRGRLPAAPVMVMWAPGGLAEEGSPVWPSLNLSDQKNVVFDLS